MITHLRILCIALALCFMHQASSMLYSNQQFILQDILEEKFSDLKKDPIKSSVLSCTKWCARNGHMIFHFEEIKKENDTILNNLVFLWNLKDRKIQIFGGPKNKHMTDMWAIHATQNLLAIASNDNVIKITNFSDNKLVQELKISYRETLDSIFFHPIKNFMFILLDSRTLEIWDFREDKRVNKLKVSDRNGLKKEPLFHNIADIVAFVTLDKVTVFTIQDGTLVWEKNIEGLDIDKVWFHAKRMLIHIKNHSKKITTFDLISNQEMPNYSDPAESKHIQELRTLFYGSGQYGGLSLDRKYFFGITQTSKNNEPFKAIAKVFTVYSHDFSKEITTNNKFCNVYFVFEADEDDKFIDDFENLNI